MEHRSRESPPAGCAPRAAKGVLGAGALGAFALVRAARPRQPRRRRRHARRAALQELQTPAEPPRLAAAAALRRRRLRQRPDRARPTGRRRCRAARRDRDLPGDGLRGGRVRRGRASSWRRSRQLFAERDAHVQPLPRRQRAEPRERAPRARSSSSPTRSGSPSPSPSRRPRRRTGSSTRRSAARSSPPATRATSPSSSPIPRLLAAAGPGGGASCGSPAVCCAGRVGVELDLNGVVKGLTVDDAAALLSGPGFVAAGGDLAVRGGAVAGLPGGGAIDVVSGGLATSGTATRQLDARRRARSTTSSTPATGRPAREPLDARHRQRPRLPHRRRRRQGRVPARRGRARAGSTTRGLPGRFVGGRRRRAREPQLDARGLAVAAA